MLPSTSERKYLSAQIASDFPAAQPFKKGILSFSFFKLEREPLGFKQNFFSLRRINVILRLFKSTYLQVAGVQTLHA